MSLPRSEFQKKYTCMNHPNGSSKLHTKCQPELLHAMPPAFRFYRAEDHATVCTKTFCYHVYGSHRFSRSVGHKEADSRRLPFAHVCMRRRYISAEFHPRNVLPVIFVDCALQCPCEQPVFCKACSRAVYRVAIYR